MKIGTHELLTLTNMPVKC